MKNIYFDRLREELQHYVDDFIRLRTATLAQMELDHETLRNPRPSMERTFGQAVERAFSLRQQMLTKGKQFLDTEKDKLSKLTETTVLEELKKLNHYHDFRNRLSYMPMSQMRQFNNDDTLSETDVHQIKAELAQRESKAKSVEEAAEIHELIQSIRYISPAVRLKEAADALEQLRLDKNVYPFLPAHLAMDNHIPRLLGSGMLSETEGNSFFNEEV